MKLFITNKDEFDNSDFDSKEIHGRAFNLLRKAIDVDEVIPINLTIHISNSDLLASFIFVTKKDDIFYYLFNGTF
jgi:hypothetical protein